VNKKSASAAQLANCILLHAYSHTATAPIIARAQVKTTYSLFNELI